MKPTIKELAIQHAAKVAEYKRRSTATFELRREAMKFSSNWAVRATADVDFLNTEEELQLYYGALVASDNKMRNYK